MGFSAVCLSARLPLASNFHWLFARLDEVRAEGTGASSHENVEVVRDESSEVPVGGESEALTLDCPDSGLGEGPGEDDRKNRLGWDPNAAGSAR